jgi:hypothetical protein
MKNRYGRVLRPGQNGDYMLRSRSRSGSEEHEPMTIEYCSNYKEFLPNDMPPTEFAIDQLAAEAFTEEFQLIQYGDFVLTAPSCSNPANSHDRSQYRGGDLEEQREIPPPEILKELARSQTMSFDVDFPSIEKTYTTFINVAEDQIYPLEWKDFLEVAREEDDRLMPLSKEHNGSPRKSPEAKKKSNAGFIAVPTEPDKKKSTQNAPSKASVNSDVNDSESLNSDARKFRLFPNIRDVASCRTKRMEAARSRRRLLDGKNDAKREKKDRLKREKECVELPPKSETKDSLVTEHDPKPVRSIAKVESPSIVAAIDTSSPAKQTKDDYSKTQSRALLKTNAVHKAAVAEIYASSTNGDIALHELAKKIMGKDVNRSENVDFTTRKRNGKKKKKSCPVIHNSTSFPADFSSETMWDVTKSTKEVLLSQDDEIVTYDQDQPAVDNSDTATVLPGVETIFNDQIDSSKGHLITLEAREEPISTPEKKSTIDSILPSFALSKSFDDLYHSFVVKSIKKEIEDPKMPPRGNVSDSIIPLARMSESVPHSESKWFGVGKQLWHHTSQSREVAKNETHRSVKEEKQSIEARGEVLAADFATSLSDILRSKISCISQAANDSAHEISAVSKGDSPGDELAAPIDVSIADENEHVSVVSCHTENEDEEVESVASSTMTPLYPSFIVRAGSWLTRFGAKANGLVACAQIPFGEFRVSKRSRKSRKIVAVPSLDRVQETTPTETRDEIEGDIQISASKGAVSRVDSRASSVSINSMASSKTFDSDHSNSSSSDEEENVSRTSSYDSTENVEVGWCG